MVRIPDGKSVLIQAGDILRLADVEVRITQDAVAVRR
jgi:hypothetical protein